LSQLRLRGGFQCCVEQLIMQLQVTPHHLTAGPATATATHVLHRDIETRSRAVLKTIGAHSYACDPSTEVLCVCFATDDDPVQLWRPGDPVPTEFVEAATNPSWVVCAHGAHFEDAIERHVLHPRFGFPVFEIARQRCTQAMSLALGLPARLSAVADALELSCRKDRAGERLMHQTSKPRRPHKDEDPAGVYWFEDQERLDRLYSYCAQDVEVERELYYRLPQLSATEQQLWQLSSQINARGFHIDRGFAEAARKIAQAAAPEIDQEIAQLTDEAVTTINQVAKLLSWLREHGCTLQGLDRKAIERQLLKDDLPPTAQRVLELRLGGAQAAVKKIEALLVRAGVDDRVRGEFRYHGAATGRWSGQGAQIQNLKRPVVEDLDKAITAVATGDYAHVGSLYPRPLSVVGDCIRATVCAAPGKALIGADFSSIESRVLAWVADEEWKLDSYRRFDATRDPQDEPYRVTAGKIFRTTPDKITPEQRSVGKTCDLAFGYAGGINAFRKFSDAFTDEEVKAFNREWRAAHPNIKKYWHRLDRAAWLAVQNRGRVVRCGVVTFQCNAAFLKLRLPSGRKLSYPQPRIIGDEREQRVAFADNSGGQFQACRHGQGAYGGLWTENVVSGIARDLLAGAMLRIEVAGYPITMHCHDEIVAEAPEDFGNTDEFTYLMTRKPAWALDLPIAAKAWTGKRYVK
jgi:DNA polymerase bacteriophage-type